MSGPKWSWQAIPCGARFGPVHIQILWAHSKHGLEIRVHGGDGEGVQIHFSPSGRKMVVREKEAKK